MAGAGWQIGGMTEPIAGTDPMKFRTILRTALCCALFRGAALCAQPAPPVAGDELLGIWGAEPILGPQVRGELLLQSQGRHWTSRVGGFEAGAEQVGDAVTLALPGGQGTLRVWTTSGTPEAFWIQAAGLGAPYATPVRLRAAGHGLWRGHLAPVDEPFPLYLVVTREPDGTLRGFLRNPTQNWPGRAPYYRLALDGDSVTFTSPETAKLQWRQPYDPLQRSISFNFGVPVVLTRRSTGQAVGLTPRSAGLPQYSYRSPVDLDDGWRVSDPASVAVDSGALEAIVRQLHSADPLSAASPRLHALLVARRGQLVLEEYFRGYAHDAPHDLRSASKSITSIMVGAAIHHGAALDSGTALAGGAITLGNLLTHSSGLACDDDDDASPGNEDTMQAQTAQPDWYAYFMALPQVHAPGTRYAYCSAGVNMVGQMLGKSTGLWLPRMFDSFLARPMQFADYGINLMPSGEAYSGGGMHLLPRDFLKFGQLYLDGGLWHGKRLVSAAWVRESTAHQIARADGSDDGFGWHRHTLAVGARRFQTYEASGNGGQFLVVVPALQLAVVVTAGNYGEYPVWQKIRQELIPAIMGAMR